MLPSYDDVLSRIEEAPTWFTEKGYPRYGDFKPAETNIYARYGVLFEIGCQGCTDTIKVGVDFDKSHTDHNMLLVAVDYEVMNEYLSKEKYFSKVQPEEDGFFWMPMRQSIWHPSKFDENGNGIYKTLTLEEVINEWGMGDPPSHGCYGAGETMGSFPLQTLEVWDRNFGQVVEDGIIKEWGTEQRLPELEGLDLRDEWTKENYGEHN